MTIQPAPTRRWPAEWEPHAATWMSWPRNVETWPRHLERARQEHAALAISIAESEPVQILAGGDALQSAKHHLGQTSNITLIDQETNDAWMRDHGPTFVVDADNGLIAIDWIYDAWGGKYPPFDLDQMAARRIATHLSCGLEASDWVIEGGGLETDGRGTLLTTQSCLFDPRRNVSASRSAAELELQRRLGTTRTIWLPGESMIGDDTDGHIDQIARFANPQCILVAVAEDSNDPNAPLLKANHQALLDVAETATKRLDVVPLPCPEPVLVDGVRLPASYTNFYLTTDRCFVPQFDARGDQQAVGILHECFPKHQMVPLPSRYLLCGLGSFHCLTQQQPMTSKEQH